MGSAFHQLCPRYSGTLTPTAPTAIRLCETFTFTFTTRGKHLSVRQIKMLFSMLEHHLLKSQSLGYFHGFIIKTSRQLSSDN